MDVAVVGRPTGRIAGGGEHFLWDGAQSPQKNVLEPHLCKRYCIPPEQNAEFVACMEDVLEVYCLPYDPQIPQVCLDEQSRQLIQETRTPLVAEPGKPAREDYEYERNGTANLFLFVELLGGWRHVEVTERSTAVDWAHQVRDLVDVHYPSAERIRLVMDNLNTHRLASLHEAFEPTEARRLAQRLEIHHTPNASIPQHGS